MEKIITGTLNLFTLAIFKIIKKIKTKIVKKGIVVGINIQPLGRQLIFSSNNINGQVDIKAITKVGNGRCLNQVPRDFLCLTISKKVISNKGASNTRPSLKPLAIANTAIAPIIIKIVFSLFK